MSEQYKNSRKVEEPNKPKASDKCKTTRQVEQPLATARGDVVSLNRRRSLPLILKGCSGNDPVKRRDPRDKKRGGRGFAAAWCPWPEARELSAETSEKKRLRPSRKSALGRRTLQEPRRDPEDARYLGSLCSGECERAAPAESFRHVGAVRVDPTDLRQKSCQARVALQDSCKKPRAKGQEEPVGA